MGGLLSYNVWHVWTCDVKLVRFPDPHWNYLETNSPPLLQFFCLLRSHSYIVLLYPVTWKHFRCLVSRLLKVRIFLLKIGGKKTSGQPSRETQTGERGLCAAGSLAMPLFSVHPPSVSFISLFKALLCPFYPLIPSLLCHSYVQGTRRQWRSSHSSSTDHCNDTFQVKSYRVLSSQLFDFNVTSTFTSSFAILNITWQAIST